MSVRQQLIKRAIDGYAGVESFLPDVLINEAKQHPDVVLNIAEQYNISWEKAETNEDFLRTPLAGELMLTTDMTADDMLAQLELGNGYDYVVFDRKRGSFSVAQGVEGAAKVAIAILYIRNIRDDLGAMQALIDIVKNAKEG